MAQCDIVCVSARRDSASRRGEDPAIRAIADRCIGVPWLELSVVTPGEFTEPIVHLFARHGEGRVAVEQQGGFNPDEGESGPPPDAPVTVRGYLPIDATTDSRKANIDVGLRLVAHLGDISRAVERVIDDSEWLNQEFEPIRIGRRLVIAPPGRHTDTRPDDIVIPLAPGMAFGTGHHPTTRMCLEWLEEIIMPGSKLLDVGTGSGILAIAALKSGAQRAVCLDIDQHAVDAAVGNLRRAGVADAASVYVGALPHPKAPAGMWDVVTANISAAVLCELSADLLACLGNDGVLIASGLLAERRDEVANAFTRASGVITEERAVEDWLALKVVRL